MIAMIAFAALLLGAAAGAVRLGGPDERTAATLFVLAWASTLLIQIVAGQPAAPRALLLVDLAVLICLASMAWKSKRDWPAIAAGFQSVAVAAHLSWIYDAAENLRAYLQVTGLAGFGTVGALAFSVWRRRE